MKPLPSVNDADAMAAIGRRAALSSARKDATETLRDALVAMQADGWDRLQTHAAIAEAAASRLQTLAVMWGEA